MNRARQIGGRWVVSLSLLLMAGFAADRALAVEVTVQNDSLSKGDDGNIQAGFVAGESAAAWLTSPCDGDIVAVQVFWRSLTGTAPLSLEDSIKIFEAGSFPTPGTLLETLDGPVMTDSVINEFRYLDENQTIPLIVPIGSGQVFVVSFKFLNGPNPIFGPSVVTDIDGCQAGKNGIFAIPGGWLNSCLLGVTGDFVIRAVVECGALPGACCEVGGGCADGVNESDCSSAGGAFQGEGSDCGNVTCEEACCFLPTGCVDLTVADCGIAGGFNQGPGTACVTTVCFPTGACCNPDGSCDDDVAETDCTDAGGTYQGDEVLCSSVTCPEPEGACCLSNGNCLVETETNCDIIPNSAWAGAMTDCTDEDENGTADDCELDGCTQDEDCYDGDACTADECVGAPNGTCESTYRPRPYGDVTPFGSIVPPCTDEDRATMGDGFANMLDVFGAFGAFNEGFPYAQCPCADVSPCAGDGFVNMLDVFAIFSAFNDDPACPAPCP